MILDATFTESSQLINSEFGVLARGEKGEKGDKGDKGDPGYVNINDSSVASNETWSSQKIEKELTEIDYAPAIELESKGEVITLKDSSNRLVRGLNIYGKTTQFTTTGKNLLSLDGRTTTENGITCVADISSGKVTLNGTATAQRNVRVGEITASDDLEIILSGAESGSSTTYELWLTNSSGSNILVRSYANTTPTYKMTKGENYKVYVSVASGTVCTNTVLLPMIRLATIADATHEVYTGGKPAPNPDYPQELESVGESKNLFDGIMDCKYHLTGSGNNRTVQSTSKLSSAILPVVPNMTYALSGDFSSATNGILRYGLFEDMPELGSVSVAYGTTESSNTVTIPSNCHYMLLWLYGSDKAEVEIQVELGNVATPYKPYDRGNIGVTVLGKNLVNCPEEVTFTRLYNITLETPLEPGTYTVSALVTSTDTDADICYVGFVGADTDGGYRYAALTRDTRSSGKVIIYNQVTSIQLRSSTADSHSKNDTATYKQLQIEKGETATAYEPYTSQTLTAQTPNGLPGIGDVRDEIDFAKGVYVQRIDECVLQPGIWTKAGSTNVDRYYASVVNIFGSDKVNQDYLPLSTHFDRNKGAETLCGMTFGMNNLGLVFAEPGTTTVNDFNEFLRNNEVRMKYVLINPIYHDLTAEELAQYAALHTNKPNTTVFNDANAYMELEYVADTKTYIDQKIAEISAAMLNA